MNERTQNPKGYWCQDGEVLKGFASKIAFWGAMSIIFAIMVILFNITQKNEDRYNELRYDFQNSVNAIKIDINTIMGIISDPNNEIIHLNDDLKKSSWNY